MTTQTSTLGAGLAARPVDPSLRAAIAAACTTASAHTWCDELIPDFTELFEHSALSPRAAYQLWWASRELVDRLVALDAVEAVCEILAPGVEGWLYDQSEADCTDWVVRFLACLAWVGDVVGAGLIPSAQSAGEYHALCAVLAAIGDEHSAIADGEGFLTEDLDYLALPRRDDDDDLDLLGWTLGLVDEVVGDDPDDPIAVSSRSRFEGCAPVTWFDPVAVWPYSIKGAPR
jgi:hypothetical protein